MVRFQKMHKLELLFQKNIDQKGYIGGVVHPHDF